MKRCLFCKKDSSTSKSVEHIIPECLGSKIRVLDKGVVCDVCNNYFARKVEQPLLSHQSFRNIRAYFQIPNKKGRLPSLLGMISENGIPINFKLNKQQKINIDPEYEKNRLELKSFWEKADADQHFSPLLFPVTINPPKREMSRFLAKMALESLAYRFSHDQRIIDILIDDLHYDLIRDFARKGDKVKEWPFFQRTIFPMDTEMKHPQTGEWVNIGFACDLMLTPQKETYFIFMLYGEEFAINVGGPSTDGYELWLSTNNHISPVIQRVGLSIETKFSKGRKSFFVVGNSDINKGVLFDRNHANI